MLNLQILSQNNDSYFHTNHSKVRASQRGISNDDILYVVQNSKPVFKQNLCFYSLKNPIYYLDRSHSTNLINLVVIIDADSSSIITLYKSEKAWKRIKHKSKRLSKNNYYS